MLAGVESMAEGHSYPMCNNVILMCYSWAYDKFEQAINRAHRINSLWNVNVYPIICDRSIDRKLEAMIQEKGDASELVLDGRLIGEQSSEVNLAELLEIAKKEFKDGNVMTVDETELEKEWPGLRSELSVAARAWRHKGLELIGVPASDTVALELPQVEGVEAAVATVEPPTRFHIPASKPRPVLEIQGDDMNPERFRDNLFAGLPLFELA